MRERGAKVLLLWIFCWKMAFKAGTKLYGSWEMAFRAVLNCMAMGLEDFNSQRSR